MIEYTAHSLSEYVNIAVKIAKCFPISRGQKEDYPLLPSALRVDERGNKLYSKSITKKFIDDFKSNSIMYMDKQIDYNETEWLAYAQHFGVPTCLLDFTHSHLFSLLFAVENAFQFADDEKNSVVWFLNVDKLNMRSINHNGAMNISLYGDSILNSSDYPCIIEVKKNNDRIAAQNGLFVYFSYDSNALNKIDIADDVLIKVKIPHANAKYVLRDLYVMGIRFDDIYPELESISKDVLLKNNVLELQKMEDEDECKI